MAFGGAWYTILCVAFNQMLVGGGSNLLSEEEIKALTPESTAARVEGSKWVFVSEHAMLLTIWSMKGEFPSKLVSEPRFLQRSRVLAARVPLVLVNDPPS